MPIVGIVHLASLNKYKAFREEMKGLTFTDINPLGGETTLEDLKKENGTYKSILNNPKFFVDASFVVDDDGTAFIEGGLAGVNGFKVTVTEENRGTLLQALHHNTFGWARQLNANAAPGGKTQLDRAVEVLNEPIASNSTDDGLEVVSLFSSSNSG